MKFGGNLSRWMSYIVWNFGAKIFKSFYLRAQNQGKRSYRTLFTSNLRVASEENVELFCLCTELNHNWQNYVKLAAAHEA